MGEGAKLFRHESLQRRNIHAREVNLWVTATKQLSHGGYCPNFTFRYIFGFLRIQLSVHETTWFAKSKPSQPGEWGHHLRLENGDITYVDIFEALNCVEITGWRFTCLIEECLKKFESNLHNGKHYLYCRVLLSIDVRVWVYLDVHLNTCSWIFFCMWTNLDQRNGLTQPTT